MKLPRRSDSPPVIERLLEHGWSVMLYDGDCNLCSGGVDFIARRTERSLVAFSAMQSPPGREALSQLGKSADTPESLIVLTGGRVLSRSEALLHILGLMRTPWPWVARVAGIVPGRLRDSVYTLIAVYRYRLFGRRASCMLRRAGFERRFVR